LATVRGSGGIQMPERERGLGSGIDRDVPEAVLQTTVAVLNERFLGEGI